MNQAKTTPQRIEGSGDNQQGGESDCRFPISKEKMKSSDIEYKLLCLDEKSQDCFRVKVAQEKKENSEKAVRIFLKTADQQNDKPYTSKSGLAASAEEFFLKLRTQLSFLDISEDQDVGKFKIDLEKYFDSNDYLIASHRNHEGGLYYSDIKLLNIIDRGSNPIKDYYDNWDLSLDDKKIPILYVSNTNSKLDNYELGTTYAGFYADGKIVIDRESIEIDYKKRIEECDVEDLITPTEREKSTIAHESGHAIFEALIPKNFHTKNFEAQYTIHQLNEAFADLTGMKQDGGFLRTVKKVFFTDSSLKQYAFGKDFFQWNLVYAGKFKKELPSFNGNTIKDLIKYCESLSKEQIKIMIEYCEDEIFKIINKERKKISRLPILKKSK